MELSYPKPGLDCSRPEADNVRARELSDQGARAVDLDLVLNTRTSGRASAPVHLFEVRELVESDLHLLDLSRETTTPHIQRLRDSHHALARALASGMRPQEAQIVTGYSASRISILQNDPSFKELVAFYRDNQNAAYANLHDRLSVLSLDATEELADRLRENPDSLSSGMLLDIVKATADRTGYGPATKSTTVNINVDLADRLAAARQRAGLVALPPPKEEPVDER